MKENNISEKQEFRYIARIVEADLKGDKKILPSLRKIKGVSFISANAICDVTKVNPEKQVGNLTEEEINKLTDAIKNPQKYKIPAWIYNRKKDFETGTDKHLTGSDLRLQKEFDIKHLKKIKCYRGIRHSIGLPVRGQRTRSNFRHGKTVGVRKKGLKAPSSTKREKK